MNLLDFEKQHKDILETIEEWNYLRIRVGFFLKNKDQNRKKIKRNKIQIFTQSLKHSFYGVKNWFRKYDFIFFSYTDQRKLVNGRMFDKLCDPIIEKLNEEKALMIEQANPLRYKNVTTKYIVSRELLSLLEKAISTVINFFIRTENSISNILEEHEIEINTKKEITNFTSSFILYNILFKLYRPKAIFIICSYCNLPIIVAAKKNSIKVIELQHGIVAQEHFGYVSTLQVVNRNLYIPDYFLSFGDIKLQNLVLKNIVPVGSFYLEYIQKHFNKNITLQNLQQKYRILIGISVQNATWEIESLQKFLDVIAQKDMTIGYILIPRNHMKNEALSRNKNVIWFDETDCYQTIMHCDIHMTLYSSCAIEAPFLGIPNILLNTRNFAERYYGKILGEDNSMILETEEDFFKSIDLLLQKRDKLRDNYHVIVPQYEYRIDSFLQVMERE